MKRSLIFWGTWLLILGILGYLLIGRRSTLEAPMWPVPDFQMVRLTETGTTPVSLKDLRGTPWVANFIFTRCSGPCPLSSSRMARLQDLLPTNVHLVTFTVDPDYDEPAALRPYAKIFKANLERWFFIRGSKGDLYKLLYEGFRLPLAENPKNEPGARVTHSTQFVLVDAQGQVRKMYDVDAADLTGRISRDVDLLIKESK